jgi:hypothetical protein
MSDRLRDAIEAVLRGMLPTLPNYLRWEYRCVAVSPGPPVLISGVPIDETCPHGTLANIALWPGPDGGYAIPVIGSLILVEFHDGNPEKPAVCGLDPNSTPTLTTFGGGISPIGLAPLISFQLSEIAAALTSHVHTGVTTGAGTSGPAAPQYTPGNVGSAIVVSG